MGDHSLTERADEGEKGVPDILCGPQSHAHKNLPYRDHLHATETAKGTDKGPPNSFTFSPTN